MTIIPFVSVMLTVAAAQSFRATPTVTGAPYSADQVQEYTRTLENGTSTTTSPHVIGHFFRDSQGRTRTESALKSSPTWRIEILDPLAGVAYILDDKNKVAHRTHTEAAAPGQNAPQPQMTIVKLGMQIMEEVLVEGTRTSIAVPPRDGRSTFTIETWDSVELKVNMLTKSSNGYTTKLVNLRRADPDPAFFRPPADYTIVDQ